MSEECDHDCLDCDQECDVFLLLAEGEAKVWASITREGNIFRTNDAYEGDHGVHIESITWKSLRCIDFEEGEIEVKGGKEWIKEMNENE